MSHPKTYLLTPPKGSEDLFGSAMSSHNMLTRLKRINPRIWVEENYPEGVWFPGKASGLTCMWYGEAQNKEHSKKITGFVPGMIPEYTQLNPNGHIMNLGWRRILEKVISSGACRRAHLENAFGITLDLHEETDGWCHDCLQAGKRIPSTGAHNRCHFHTHLASMMERVREKKRDMRWLRRKECHSSTSQVRSSPMASQTIPNSALSG
jgi:hypothetical protein